MGFCTSTWDRSDHRFLSSLGLPPLFTSDLHVWAPPTILLAGQLMMSKINERRQAYVSMVHTDPTYVCGAIVLAHSIRLSGSTRDLVMLVDANILPEEREGLEAAGWKVREIERIRNPYAKKDRYNEWNYSKFRLWQLTEYDKVA